MRIISSLKALIFRSPQNNSQNRLRGIVMGQAGVGKTTLVNKLCGTDFLAGTGQAQTKNLYIHPTNVGDYSFDIIDTPGNDSKEDAYKNSFLLRTALTSLPVNTIFIVVKYETRFEKIVENFLKTEAAVSKYNHKVVAMISHWDNSKNPEEDSKRISTYLEGSCSNIIYYSEGSCANGIANTMFRCLFNMEKEDLNIDEEEFFLGGFNIFESKLSMFRDQRMYMSNVSKLNTAFNDLLLQDFPQLDQEERDDFLHSIMVAYKDEMEFLQTEFMKKYKETMLDLDFYVFWISLQKECVQATSKFCELISEKMSYSLNDSQDPRNLIKRCPNCQEIWFKIEGCDGQTTCGANEWSQVFDVLKKPLRKYLFTRNNGKYTWKKVELPKIQPGGLVRKNGKKIGCQKPFIWKDQPKLETSLILELFQLKSLDHVKELLRKDDFRRFKQEYDSSIDTSMLTE